MKLFLDLYLFRIYFACLHIYLSLSAHTCQQILDLCRLSEIQGFSHKKTVNGKYIHFQIADSEHQLPMSSATCAYDLEYFFSMPGWFIPLSLDVVRVSFVPVLPRILWYFHPINTIPLSLTLNNGTRVTLRLIYHRQNWLLLCFSHEKCAQWIECLLRLLLELCWFLLCSLFMARVIRMAKEFCDCVLANLPSFIEVGPCFRIKLGTPLLNFPASFVALYVFFC